jgi:hypothetical protein
MEEIRLSENKVKQEENSEEDKETSLLRRTSTTSTATTITGDDSHYESSESDSDSEDEEQKEEENTAVKPSEQTDGKPSQVVSIEKQNTEILPVGQGGNSGSGIEVQ